jgi:hypothetical protein
MLSFAAGKRKPGFLSEAGLLGDLVSPVSVVAGACNRRSLASPQRIAEASSLRRLVPAGLVSIAGLRPASAA